MTYNDQFWFYVESDVTSDGGLANPKATESNVLLPRALCRDDDTPSMDGLASDVSSAGSVIASRISSRKQPCTRRGGLDSPLRPR